MKPLETLAPESDVASERRPRRSANSAAVEACNARAASAHDITPDRIDRAQLRADWRELVKPRITSLVVLTSAVGFLMAIPLGAISGAVILNLLVTLAGAAVACMGSSVLNQVLERETDAKMPRTAERPLACGRGCVKRAAVWGVVLAIVGVSLQAAAGLYLAAGLTALTVLIYVLVYTPLKAVTPWALWIGAIPGALPPMIGYAGGSTVGQLDAIAWLLFGIMVLWQVPHFLAIAWMYRDQYAAAGLKMLTVVDPSGKRAGREAVLASAALVIVGVLPTLLGITGWATLIVATLLGGGMLWLSIAWARDLTRERARTLFFASLVYLPVVLMVMPIERVVGWWL